MAVVYTDRINISKKCGGQINVAATNSLITNTIVNANATLTLLKAAILVAAVRPDDYPLAIKTNKALDAGKAIGIWSETHGFTTVAGLTGASDLDVTTRRIGILT